MRSLCGHARALTALAVGLAVGGCVQPRGTSSQRSREDRNGLPKKQSDGCDVHGGADIDRRGARMSGRDILTGSGSLCLSHDILLMVIGEAGLCKKFNFLTGIATEASPLSSAQQPMDHVM